MGKVFNVHGAGSYKGCLWCDIKGIFLIIIKSNYKICLIAKKCSALNASFVI